MPIDLPNIAGKTHHDVEQAILRLREGLESAQAQAAAAAWAVANAPPPLTLTQIQQALSAAGSHPIQTAALIGTTPPPSTPPTVPPVPPGQTYGDDYADACSDGTLVVCAAPSANSSPTVVFGTDAPIVIPSAGRFLWAEKVGSAHKAIVQGLDGNAYVVTRGSATVVNAGVAYGSNAVGLRTDGTTVVQDTASTYKVGGSSTPIPAPFVGTQHGFLMLDSGGNPVWTDAQIATPVVINDVTFAVASTDGNWTVGRSTLTGQFLAYNSGTGNMYIVGLTLGTPVAPRITQLSDGTAIVSRSLPTAFFYSGLFTPYSITPPPPPSPLDLNTVIWVGLNAKDWAVTSTINSATHSGGSGDLCIDHTKAGLWPPVLFFDTPDYVEGNQWLFAFISGQWYAGAAEWLRPGQICKNYSGFVGEDFAGTPMGVWSPVPGELVYVMVSCPARAGQWTLAERSNVVAVTW